MEGAHFILPPQKNIPQNSFPFNRHHRPLSRFTFEHELWAICNLYRGGRKMKQKKSSLAEWNLIPFITRLNVDKE
jgi:hypothetical protein